METTVKNASNQTTFNPKGQKGFTLFELAISITVLGIFMSGLLFIGTSYMQAQKVRLTREKMDMLANALSTYVQANYRLPCPADPAADTGMELNNGKCFNTSSLSNLYADNEGVLPWKELGISKEMVMDGWNRYITYKPAPNLTMDMQSNNLQRLGFPTASAQGNYVHNACRTPMWFDENANHVNRAKALFCCNASPNTDYLTSADAGTQPSGTVPANWQSNGVITTDDAAALGALGAGNTLPGTAPVLAANTWHDDNLSANARNTNGDFLSANYANNFPDSPLIRATSNAVTLISHGSNGFMSFMDKQPKTSRLGGTVNSATGPDASAAGAALEKNNVWPPQAFAGVKGSPKSNGTFDLLGRLANGSDDLVYNMRSDQLFAKAGNGSCNLPPNAAFKPYECQRQEMKQVNQSIKNPTTGMDSITPVYKLQLKLTGENYSVSGTFTRGQEDAGYHNSVGVYSINADGTINNVKLVIPDVKNVPLNGSVKAEMSVPADALATGVFLIPNGANTNNFSNIDFQKDKFEFYHDYTGAGKRLANITDKDPPTLVVTKSDGSKQIIRGASNVNPYHMFSNMNDFNVNRSLRKEDMDAGRVTKKREIGPDANGLNLKFGFEDLQAVNCYYTASGCEGNPADADKLTDEYGGYIADIGDNDYDDVYLQYNVVVCPSSGS